MTTSSARVVLVAGLAALLIAFAIGGTHASRRVAGSNGVLAARFVAVIAPRQELCQSHVALPAGTGFLRMTLGTYGAPGPTLRASVRAGAAAPRVGRLAPGWKEGIVDVPLGATSPRALSDVRICIRSSARMAVAGERTGRRGAAKVAGRACGGRVRMAFVEARRRSAWDLAGRMASRLAFGRGLWDGVAPWAALALVLLAGAGAARALLSAPRAEATRDRP